jgi:GTP-binding protein YchF
MRVGICGYPGSGKSTIFTALAPGAHSDGKGVAYGNIKVPDDRVDRLAAIFHPKKSTYAEITFVDVGAGRKSAKGAFPPDVLENMRNTDLLVHVVRVFDNPNLSEPADPARDMALFRDELILLDLAILEKRQDRWRRESRKGLEVEVNDRCVACLRGGAPLRTLELTRDERATLRGVQLLSRRPLLTLFNLSEEAWEDPATAHLRAPATAEDGAMSLALCGSIEAEVAQLDPGEQQDFLDALGLGEPARNPFIRAAYQLLDLISILTCGPDECRAWPIRRDTPARRAAGAIHSDMERGFIRAEVYRVEEIEDARTEAELKKRGKLRIEGKDYVVQDGDIFHVLFNV